MRLGKRNVDILNGPIFLSLVQYALPIVLTTLLQTFYSAADMMIVGLSGVEGALGAISTTGSMTHLVLTVFTGLSVGTNVVVARHIGAKDREETQQAVHTAIATGIVLGIFSGVLGQIICRPMLILMGDEGRILDLATLYCRYIYAGVPFSALTNFSAAIFRAQGDSKTPLWVLSLSGIINVLLNLLFVLGFKMSVDGVGLATLLSNLLSSVLLLGILSRREGWCRLYFRRLRICFPILGEMAYVGVPTAIQTALFSVSNMLIQSSLITINNQMYPGGSIVLDGNAAGASLYNFAHSGVEGVSNAAVTFTSQHYGAKKYRRIGKVMANSYLLGVIVTVSMCSLIMVFHDFFAGLYVQAPEALEVAKIRNSYMINLMFILTCMSVGTSILRGLGKSITSMIISLLGICGFRVVWILLVFPQYSTLQSLYISYPISWTLSTLVSFSIAMIVWRRLCRKEAPAAAN